MTEPSSTRRGFLSAVTLFLASLPFVGGLALALRTALAPAKADKPKRLPLCKFGEVTQTDVIVRSVSYTMRRGPKVESVSQVVLVTKDDDGSILAMSGECTHLSCPVQKKDIYKTPNGDAPLSCPCHGGRFSRTGEVLDGPPPRPLRRLRIEALPAEPRADTPIWLLEV